MKRKILAVVIPSLLLAGMANATEIYNKDGNKLDLEAKVDARHQFSENKGDDGDETYLRVGFRGETQISDQLTGFGQWEYNVQANHTEGGSTGGTSGNATRLGFAGLKFGDYGSFDYGRNYGVVYDVEAWTDMLPVFGGDSYTQTDTFMNTRGNGMATYRNSDFFGLVEGWNFALQYQGANDNGGAEGNGTNNGDRKTSTQNGDGFGVSTTYDTGMGLNFGASFATSNRTHDQEFDSTAGGHTADVWTIGAKYDANNVYLAAMYAQTQNMTAFGDTDGYIANKTQNVELTAQYQFDFGLRPSLGYVYSKGKDLGKDLGSIAGDGRHDNKTLVNYIEVGTYYYFNKNMSTYIDYKINLMNDNDFTRAAGITTDDVVGVGLVYQF
ncbi:porin OmpC [Hafnia paralvei]|uniref:porin OmpC n=1 Tax=Hafnia paralvei TaxID=546367 RepID=UPI0010348110|nr:porin OmpC [Hafnia paralvei]TBM05139.1 porin OmpC [Hafnia paralvei]